MKIKRITEEHARQINIKDLKEKYLKTNENPYSNNTEEEDFFDDLKHTVKSLSDVEQIIFLLYVDGYTYKRLGEVLHCSTTKTFYLIRNIKEKIKKRIKNKRY